MAEEDPDRRHFARLLKAFREARGLSRADLGALAGYSESTIKSFETSQRAVYEYHARHFDEAFGLDDVFVHEASRFGKAGYSLPTARSTTLNRRRKICTRLSTQWSWACSRPSAMRGRYSPPTRGPQKNWWTSESLPDWPAVRSSTVGRRQFGFGRWWTRWHCAAVWVMRL